eukprot:TRINITY_DN33630_c0_g1_i1.p1 TRINITY_DN33630_c0_g1~~TRINITY_DN33630_c0_g1_i1.p1  ORF type:complete len:388 (+),score=76.62 TRINITY_DN33630_c0_g1_i1:25-1188(+)
MACPALKATAIGLLLHPAAGFTGLKAQIALQPEFNSGTQRLRMEFPFYHTSEELNAETVRLSKECKSASLTVKTVKKGNVTIDDIRVSKGGQKVNRVSLVFGEHSRELISSETGLTLLRMLCGELPPQSSLVEKALEDSEFQLMLNTNPISRANVEQNGDYCWRWNPAGVDLNRNWNDKRDAFAFSEPETQAVRDSILDFRPTTFLSVHSGTLGLYMPWANDTLHMAERNRGAMLSVLQELDASHCQCPFGAAGKEMDYDAPGTSFDWVYDNLSVPFSFLWEIYANPLDIADLRRRWQAKLAERSGSLLQERQSLEHLAFSVLDNGESDVVSPLTNEQRLRCFSLFNPGTKDEYDKVVDEWAKAYLHLATLTASHVKQLSSEGFGAQ